MGEILIISLIVLIVLNVPIALSIGFASFIAIWTVGKVPLFLVSQRMFSGCDSFPLLAIPLFMVAGGLMDRGGISKRLIDFATAFVGHISGGLGIIAILACMFFAAISGSAPATVVAIGSIMIPAMIQAGYDKSFSVALLAAAGTIGVVIPPSIPFVTYGVTMNSSIGKLFAAGMIPGILMGLSLMFVCYIISKKNGYRADSTKQIGKWAALKESFWCLFMPVIILGGIYGGVFTPTEAAGVACFYAMIIGIFVYRELNFKALYECLHCAAVPSAMVMIIIACATAMGWITTAEQIPQTVANYMTGVTESKFMMLLLLNVFLLFVGCLMELNAAIILLGPILLPLLGQYHIDPLHFGVVMVVNLAVGLLTPPLGVNLFVANGLRRDVEFKAIIVNSFPMLMVLFALILLLTYVPQVSLFLTHFV